MTAIRRRRSMPHPIAASKSKGIPLVTKLKDLSQKQEESEKPPVLNSDKGEQDAGNDS